MTDNFITEAKKILDMSADGMLIDKRSYEAALSGVIKEFNVTFQAAAKLAESQSHRIAHKESQIAALYGALDSLLHATMHKDHPAESDRAIAVLADTKMVAELREAEIAEPLRSQNAALESQVAALHDALKSAIYLIKGREHTGKLTDALANTAQVAQARDARVRDEALEEAAIVASKHFVPGHTVAGPYFAERCADLIRALKTPPTQQEKT